MFFFITSRIETIHFFYFVIRKRVEVPQQPGANLYNFLIIENEMSMIPKMLLNFYLRNAWGKVTSA